MYLKDNDALHYAPVWGCDAMDAPYSCWLLLFAVRCFLLELLALLLYAFVVFIFLFFKFSGFCVKTFRLLDVATFSQR